MANNSFVFYRGFFDILKKLTDSQKTEFVMKLCAYALDGEEPTFDEGSPLDLIFIAVKPQIDANMRRIEKGKFGERGKEYGVMGKDFGILGKEYGSLGGEFGVLGKEFGKLGGRPKKTPPPLKKTPAPPNANANANVNANANANANANEDNIIIIDDDEKKEKEKKVFDFEKSKDCEKSKTDLETEKGSHSENGEAARAGMRLSLPDFIPTDDVGAWLERETGTAWRETVCRQLGCSMDDLPWMYAQYVDELRLQGIERKDTRDIKPHFVNMMRMKIRQAKDGRQKGNVGEFSPAVMKLMEMYCKND